MTSYIDSPGVATTEPKLAGPVSPFGTLLPGVIALWTLPLNMLQIWTQSWSSVTATRDPEVDRSDYTAQLPIPNPLQKAKDRELFA